MANNNQTGDISKKIEEEYREFLSRLEALRKEEERIIEEYKENLKHRKDAWLKED